MKNILVQDYIVVVGPKRPVSILDIFGSEPNRFHAKNGGRWKNEQFAHEEKTSSNEWIVLKIPVPGSTDRTPDVQAGMLSRLEYVPNAVEVIWALAMYEVITGVFLIPHICVRTSSYGDDGYPIVVGRDSDDGIIIRSWKGNRPDGMIGLAAKRIL